MSNFSDPPLASLLAAMAAEWGRIAQEIDWLGARLSAQAVNGAPQEMQRFDLLNQRAQGQANLLTRVCEKLADDKRFDCNRITEMLEAIPFHHVRASLEANWDGAPERAPEGAVDWF